jgi:hypothetical protein
MYANPAQKDIIHLIQKINCAKSAFKILFVMEKIILWFILDFGDHHLEVSKYISAQSRNLAKEVFFQNVRLDIKEECAMNAIEMHQMEKYMVKVALIRVKYVLKSEYNLSKL